MAETVDARVDRAESSTMGSSDQNVSTKHEPASQRGQHAGRPSPLADTVISLVLGFMVAFTFRAFFVEPFVIPTGSMAPTLLGSHVRVETDSQSWTVDARALESRSGGALSVHEPATGDAVSFMRGDGTLSEGRRVRDGERVLALKHAYAFRDPDRYEVAIFRSPESARTNFIKRVVGLPGERVALVDGDVFISQEPDAQWGEDVWKIARKSRSLQRSLWRPITDARSFGLRGPWISASAVTDADGLLVPPGEHQVSWDRERWPITDRESYNEIHRPSEDETIGPFPTNTFYETHYPVSDVATSATLTRPIAPGERVSVSVSTLGFEFRATFADGRATLERREMARSDDNEPWEAMGETELSLPSQSFELWHFDQRLCVLVNGRVLFERAYEMSLAERVARSLPGRSLDGLIDEQHGQLTSVFSPPDRYGLIGIDWAFASDTGLTLSDLTVSRDLHYRSHHNPGAPLGHSEIPLATHPDRIATLGEGEYFMLGDNSGASADSRVWEAVHELVRERLGDIGPGVVPRELIIGRAVFVYLPSPSPAGELGRWFPRLDVGRVRWIR